MSHDPYAAIRLPAYRRYLGSLVAMTLATQMRGVAVGWQLYDLTGDPLALGLAGLAEALPFVAGALPAGHLADRRDRRALALGALVLLALCAAALAGLACRPGVAASGRVRWLYGIIAVSGVARTLLLPARWALATQLVPRALYPNAVAWRSGSWEAAAVLGPALGGVLYGAGGAGAVYLLDAGLMALAVALMWLVPRVARAEATASRGGWRGVLEGVAFVRGQPVLLGALSLDLFAVLFGGATALLPVFARDILHAGPAGLGALRAAPAVGAIATALVLAHRAPLERMGPALLASVALFGLAIAGFGLSTSLVASVALLAASGAADSVSVNIRGTLLQLLTPDHLMGRVSAVNQVFIGSSNEIGAFESGVAARLLGAVPAVVLGGMATLGVVGIVAWRVPALRRLGEAPVRA